MIQRAIITNGKEQRNERMKIVGFPNYPKFIFKKLLEREFKEKLEYGFVFHPVFKKSAYDIKINKTTIPNVSKSFFIINNDGVSLFFLKNENALKFTQADFVGRLIGIPILNPIKVMGLKI